MIDLYLSNVELIDEGLPAGIAQARGAALESLNLSGLPKKGSTGGDRYHYTDIVSVFDAAAETYFIPSYTNIPVPAGNDDEYTVNILNGFHYGIPEPTQLDTGIVFGSLRAAANDPELPAARYFNRLAGENGDNTAALNTIFASDGAFVYLPGDTILDKPVRIKLLYYSENETVNIFPRILIIGEKASAGKIVIEHHSLSSEKFVATSVVEVFAAEQAQIDIAETFTMNPDSTVIENVFASQAASSRVDSLSFALSGKMVRSNITVLLNGRYAENHTNGLSICGAGEHFDFSTNIEHREPDCTSYEHFKAVAAEGGTGIFSGRIYVAPDAQQTQAYQKNNNLLLSDDAHIYTKPQLEIYADNVKCSHGATVGQLDQEAVYYMRQRGISEKDARRLQMHGFVNEIIGLCRIDNVCSALDRAATQKIEAL